LPKTLELPQKKELKDFCTKTNPSLSHLSNSKLTPKYQGVCLQLHYRDSLGTKSLFFEKLLKKNHFFTLKLGIAIRYILKARNMPKGETPTYSHNYLKKQYLIVVPCEAFRSQAGNIRKKVHPTVNLLFSL
jgi:hypothetical protein